MHKQQVPLRIQFSTAAGSGDWARQLNAHTNASSLEKIEDGQLLESSSVAAALLELEVRFDLAASKIQLVPPHVTVTLCSADGLLLQQKEREEFLSQLWQKAQLFFVIWSEARHYTLLHLSRKMGDSHYTTTYMDSLRAPAKGNIVVAKQLLCNLGLNSEATALVPSNTEFQGDGWSCGIWCIKWTEQVLRRLRNEVPVFEGPSIHDIVVRTNEFIIAALQANEAKSLSTSASASLVSDTLKDGAAAPAAAAEAQPEGAPEAQPCRSQLCTASPCSIHGEYDACEHCEHCQQWVREMDSNADARAAASEPAAGSRAAAEAPNNGAAAPAAAAEAKPEEAKTEDVKAAPADEALPSAEPAAVAPVAAAEAPKDGAAAAAAPAPEEAKATPAAEAPKDGAAAPAALEEAKATPAAEAPKDDAAASAALEEAKATPAAEAPKDDAAASAALEEAKATPAAETPKDGAAAPAALEEAKVTPAAEALKEDLAAPALEKQEEAEAEQAKPEGATAEESQANDQTAAAIEDKAPQKTSRKPQPVSAKAKAKAKALETPEKPARTASQDHNKDNVGVIKEGTFKPLSAFMKPAAGGGPKKIQQQEDTSTAAAKKRSQKKEQESEATPPPKKRRGQGEAAAGTGTA